MDSNALFEGGATVVVFMCNHCPFVIHLLKAFVEVADEYQAKGVNFIAISSNNTATHPQDGFPEMGRLAEQYGMPFPYLYDESQAVARHTMLPARPISASSMPKIVAYTAANSMAPGQEMKFQLQEEMCEPHWIYC